MIGGGTLSLPFAISQTGLIGGLMLQLLSAVTAGFSLYVLIASARRTGATTYSSVAADAFGREISVVVSVLTIMLLFMGIIAYM
jgi:amino acid permease